MKSFRKHTLIMAVSAMVAAAPLAVMADYVSVANDTLSVSDGEITASDGTSWDGAGTRLEYTVEFNETDGLWKYTYEWSASRKSLSHVIFSLTESGDLGAFDYDNLLGGTGGGEIKYYGGDQSNGNSNPGIPGEMYGIKFDTSDDALDAYFEIITDRGPMWGDFYAKDGVEMLAATGSVPPSTLPYSKKHLKLLDKQAEGKLKGKQAKKLAKLEAQHEYALELLAMSEEERDGLGKKDRKRLKKLEKKMGHGSADKVKTDVWAYNAGFGADNDIWFNPDGSLAYYIADQILVPDSFDGAIPPDAIVPVPAAAWLFGSGLLGLVGVARRRKPA